MVKPMINVWLARDYEGTLWLHGMKPQNQEGVFYNPGYLQSLLPLKLEKCFEDVTYENSPKEYTITFTPKN